jgi:hypothetical protein
VAKDPSFDEPMDGLVYGMTASLGFATLENVLYVGEGGANVALMRALTAVPGHACTGAIMGAYVARAKFGSQRARNLWLAFLVPMALHGAYDTFLFTASGWALMGVGVLLVEIAWMRSVVKSFAAEQRPALGGQVAGAGEPRRPAGLWAWFKLVAGFVVASVGSLLLLLFAGTYFIEVHDEETTLGFAVIAAIVGLPTLVSVALFRSGLRDIRAVAPA